MYRTDYSDEQRASNRRSVARIGAGLVVLFLVAALFGPLGPVGLAALGIGGVAFMVLLWWLFASTTAKPVPDPGPEGRRAALLGTFFTFFGSS